MASQGGGFYRKVGKRALDFLAALFLLALFSPLLLLLAILVRIKLGSPVLFKQQRPGQSGKPFWILKFRTMLNAQNANGNPLPDSERLTGFGRKLRSSSLDELPEFINVLRGDMSLVGPRPLLMSYLARYSPEQARRHEVLPGITGWAQVNGRNSLSWDEKFRLDLEYVDGLSPWLDLKILWITMAAVTRRKGVSAEGHATMPEFMGESKT